jgi:hypothetical protein
VDVSHDGATDEDDADGHELGMEISVKDGNAAQFAVEKLINRMEDAADLETVLKLHSHLLALEGLEKGEEEHNPALSPTISRSSARRVRAAEVAVNSPVLHFSESQPLSGTETAGMGSQCTRPKLSAGAGCVIRFPQNKASPIGPAERPKFLK